MFKQHIRTFKYESANATYLHNWMNYIRNWRKTPLWDFGDRLYDRTYSYSQVYMKKGSWEYDRIYSAPPYSQKAIDFYTIKLMKLKLLGEDEKVFWEIKHCEEILASHKRLQEMERRKELHDFKDPATISSSNPKC